MISLFCIVVIIAKLQPALNVLFRTSLFKLLNLRQLYPADYDVTISSKCLSEFKSDDENITTWIALEPDSKFPKH